MKISKACASRHGEIRGRTCSMILAWGNVLLLLIVCASTIEMQTVALDTTCPLDFSVLRKFPWIAEQVKKHNKTLQCTAITSGLQLVMSMYIRSANYFLVPEYTVDNCVGDYNRLLHSQGVSDANISDICRVEYTDLLKRGNDLCLGIQTSEDFAKKVPSKQMSTLTSNCEGDLRDATRCSVCVTSLVPVSTTLVNQTGTTGGCSNFTLVYTGGVINKAGPDNAGTALCLYYIETHAKGSSGMSLLYIVIGVGGMLLLCIIAAVIVYCQYKKTTLAKSRARQKRDTDFYEKSMAPKTGLVWFTIDELKAATSNFNRSRLLGTGGYGNVYRGVLPSGQEVAVKRFKNCSPAADSEFLHEVEMISSVRHKHLVAIRGCCVDSSNQLEGHQRIIVYDLMPNGSLQDHLFGDKPMMDGQMRLKIALGIARGLSYLHTEAKPAIIHRDIKASNVLLDADFNPRLCDFGLAKFSPDGITHVTTRVAGTYGYVAPEYALYGQLTERSDVYSFGIVLLELVTGRKALSSNSESPRTLITDWAWPLVKQGRWRDVVDTRIVGQVPDEVMERLALIAFLCAHPQVYCRPTISQALTMMENENQLPSIPDRPLPLTSEKSEIEAAILAGHASELAGFLSFASTSSTGSTVSSTIWNNSRELLNDSRSIEPLGTSRTVVTG